MKVFLKCVIIKEEIYPLTKWLIFSFHFLSFLLVHLRMSSKKVILKEFELLNCSTEPDFFGGAEVVGTKGEKISKSFKKSIKVNVVKKEGFDLEFDLIGVDPSIPNAIRRILLSGKVIENIFN